MVTEIDHRGAAGVCGCAGRAGVGAESGGVREVVPAADAGAAAGGEGGMLAVSRGFFGEQRGAARGIGAVVWAAGVAAVFADGECDQTAARSAEPRAAVAGDHEKLRRR